MTTWRASAIATITIVGLLGLTETAAAVYVPWHPTDPSAAAPNSPDALPPDIGAPPHGRGYVPGELAVKFKNASAASLQAATTTAAVKSLARVFGDVPPARRPVGPHAQALRDGLSRIYLLTFDSHADIDAIARKYRADPNVEYAEPNRIVRAADTIPNDPRFSEQWGHQAIRSASAWDIQKGSAGVVIAIIDTGTDYNHPDLAANMWVNPDEIPDNGIDDDHNGFIDDVRGWDFVGPDYKNPVEDNDPMDDMGHGTHTAGIAAAVTNNSVGVAGTSWHSKIMPVKFLDAEGWGTDVRGALAICYAVENGANILSNSWGGYGESSVIRDAVDYAHASGCIVVAAAGNDSADVQVWPGGLPNVIGVGATSESESGQEEVASFSNYGRWVDVFAPGDGIVSTIPDGQYESKRGTSMATPFVSGLCALVISQHPDWSNTAVMGQVASTADSLAEAAPFLWSQGLLGSGRINAYSALTASRGTRLVYVGYSISDPLGDNDGMVDPGETFDLQIRLKNTWSAVSSASVTITSPSPFLEILKGSATYGPIGEWEEATPLTPITLRATSDCPPDYALPIGITIRAGDGYVRTDSFSVVSLHSPWRFEGLGFSDECGCGTPVLNSLAVDASGRIYAGEGTGFFHETADERDGLYVGTRAPDGTVNWQRLGVANGFPPIYTAYDLHVSDDGVNVCLGSTSSEGTWLWRSTDSGASFARVTDVAQFECAVLGVVVDPCAPDRLYMLCRDTSTRRCLLRYSSDGGLTWSIAANFDERYSLLDVVLDAQDAGALYACGATSRYGFTVGCVLRSSDGGVTWQESVLSAPTTAVPWALTASGGQVYVAATVMTSPYQQYLYHSRDGGLTWTATKNAFDPLGRGTALAVHIDAADPSSAYAVVFGSGQYKSVVSGAEWFPMIGGECTAYGRACAQESSPPYRFYVGDLYGGGVFSYEPGHWERSPSPCLVVSPPTGLAGRNEGSYIEPASMTYTLTNDGLASLNWTASSTRAWVTVTPSAGAIAPRENASVTVTIDAGASKLPPGTYDALVEFANTTNARGASARPVTLTIEGAHEPVYVKWDAPGPVHDGKSWQTAYTTIGEALNAAGASREIRVARGVYSERPVLKEGSTVRGGYAGVAGVRDLEAYPSTVQGFGGASSATVDGFNIAIPSGKYGISTSYRDFMVVSNNSFSGGSIGIQCESNAVVINNSFSGQTARAIYSYAGAPLVTGNTISGCYQGVYLFGGSAAITNNVISQCRDGVYAGNYCSPTIVNNTISGCTSSGIACADSSPAVANNIITFSKYGIVTSRSTPTLANNDLYGNATNYFLCSPGVTDISADPLYVAADSGGFRLRTGSPCIDKGSSSGAPAVDRDEVIRPQDGNGDHVAVCDIGAFEYRLDLASARRDRPDGTAVAFGGVSVSAAASQGGIYVEKPDRTAGVRVETTQVIPEGQLVNVAGVMRTDAATGERYVQASDSWPRAMPATCLIAPLELTMEEFGGGGSGLQSAVWSWRPVCVAGEGCELEWLPAQGLANIGLLVRACGRVTQIDPLGRYFYLDDGSPVTDSTFTGATPNLGVRVASEGRGLVPGACLAVTGISSCFKGDDGCVRRLLRPTRACDVQSFY